jgi:hypothetical protein
VSATPRIVALLAVAAAAVPGNAYAQLRFGAHVEGIAAVPRIERRAPNGTLRLNGTAFGIAASVGFGGVGLSLQYLEGPIRTDTSTTFVQGGAFLTVQPVPFAYLALGARARAFVTDAATDRWLEWQARTGVNSRLLPQLRSYLSLWYGFAGSVNSGASLSNGRGVSGGLVFQPTGFPLWITAAYSADRSALTGGTRVDVVEEFTFSVGIGRRR